MAEKVKCIQDYHSKLLHRCVCVFAYIVEPTLSFMYMKLWNKHFFNCFIYSTFEKL